MKHPALMSVVHAEELPSLAPDQFEVRTTNTLEKLFPSILNAVIAFGIATPVLAFYGPGLTWKLSVIVIFALYESYVFLMRKDRCFGMKIVDTYYKGPYSMRQHFIYNIFYTLSFSTTLLYIWYPLDLLVFNILCVQLPCVLITGMTLHGYLSGVTTVKIVLKGT